MNETIFRILAGIILLIGISISVYHRRKADRETGEKVSARGEGTLLYTVLRLGGLLIWLSALAWLVNPAWLDWFKIGLPIWVRWVGVGTGIICDLLILWLFRSLGISISPTVGTRSNHRLVKSGPYRYVRHPLYSVGSSLFISYALMADNWFFAALAVLAFVLLAIRLPKEEGQLIARFGDEYRDYIKNTGAFFPRLKL